MRPQHGSAKGICRGKSFKMIGWISAEEMLKNILAWIGLRGTGIVLAAVVSWWLCRIACKSIAVFRRKLTAIRSCA